MTIYDNNYWAVHKWLGKTFGIANTCEEQACTYKNPKRYEYSLIRGKEMKKVRSHFRMLCVSCHRKYDITDVTREKMRQRIADGFRPSSSPEARASIGAATRARNIGTIHTNEHKERTSISMQDFLRSNPRRRNAKGHFIKEY